MNERVAKAILYTPGCFRSVSNDPAILVCREISPYYVDLRAVNSFPDQRNEIVDEMVGFIRFSKFKGDFPKKIDKLITTESAGIPICSMVGDRLGIGIAYVKKEVKGYGLGKQIEGAVFKGDIALGVDDLTTEATTAIRAINETRNAGAEINEYCVIFDRNQGATKKLADLNVRLNFLAQMNPEFTEMALENGVIKEEEHALFSKYAENPTEWSRNFVKENPGYLKGKLAKVVKEGKITDMAPLEVLTKAHPDLKGEFEPTVNKWMEELGVKQEVPEFNYVPKTA